MTNPALAAELEGYIVIAESRFVKMFNNDPSFETELLAGLNFGHPDPNATAKLQLFKLHLISAKTFEALIGGGEGFKPMFTNLLWEGLVRARVIVRQFTNDRGDAALADHSVDMVRLLRHLRDLTFWNLFFPPSNLHRRYAPTVVAIDVVKKTGGVSRGSGFIVQKDVNSAARWLLTCRHNVDPAEVTVTAMTTGSSQSISVGPVSLSEVYDLALYPVLNCPDLTPLALHDEGAVFDEVFTLGFPQVSGCLSAFLGHRGEINGKVDLYLAKCPALIISNLVSPGSSGCPVLDSEGRCVGMTIRWLEGDWDGEKARFSAALPAKLLIEHLNAHS